MSRLEQVVATITEQPTLYGQIFKHSDTPEWNLYCQLESKEEELTETEQAFYDAFIRNDELGDWTLTQSFIAEAYLKDPSAGIESAAGYVDNWQTFLQYEIDEADTENPMRERRLQHYREGLSRMETAAVLVRTDIALFADDLQAKYDEYLRSRAQCVTLAEALPPAPVEE